MGRRASLTEVCRHGASANVCVACETVTQAPRERLSDQQKGSEPRKQASKGIHPAQIGFKWALRWVSEAMALPSAVVQCCFVRKPTQARSFSIQNSCERGVNLDISVDFE